MIRIRAAVVVLLLTTLPFVCNAQQQSKPITNADVAQMVKAGLAESTILLTIKRNSTAFDTTPAALVELKKAGVSPAVLDAMLQVVSSVGTSGSAPQPQTHPSAEYKTIRDPAEYNSYMTALNERDGAAKAQALEQFVRQYSNSAVKTDALELLMATYQKTGDRGKFEDTANRLLATDPNNLRGLAVLTYVWRRRAELGMDRTHSIPQAMGYARRGQDALKTAAKPATTSDADWDKLKTQTAAIFDSAMNMHFEDSTPSPFPSSAQLPSEGDQITFQVVRSWWQGSDVFVNISVSGAHWTLYCSSCSPLSSGTYMGELGKKDIIVYVSKIGDSQDKHRKQKYRIYSDRDWIEPTR